ncbi:PorT family protein [Vicingus serpentipes]|uniref:PorT family protein n=1 Tax=Vicingus serpentipes TaxID=1926625 RepID=A0A5C6RXH1_9FLAO|nr:outer membrane beta-barrel protein [Vicingus serpentipes]TXB66052.1 PorT family protein [Vicingus serpentipes]
MKNLILLLALTIFSTVLLAQEIETLKGQEGDWGLSINISGIINDIRLENDKDANGNYMVFARKYLKDDVALRIGLNVTSDRNKWTTEDSLSLASGSRALQTVDSSKTRFDFSVLVGYEKHMAGTKRLDPYFAAELMIGRIGNTKTDATTTLKDVTGTDKTDFTRQQDGGFTMGLGLVAGFNYFIAPKFSLGAEFGFAYTYMKSGGNYSESTVNTPVSGSQTSTFILGKQEQSNNTIGISSTSGIVLSYFF